MGKAILNLDQARELRTLRSSGMTYTRLAERFGIKRSTACRVAKGYSYREPGAVRKYQAREAYRDTAVCENCHNPFWYWKRAIDPERRFCTRRCNLLFANRNNKKLPDAQTLATLYHLKRWSLQRIALKYGCCFQAVHVAMKKAGIKRRSRTEGIRTSPRRKDFSI